MLSIACVPLFGQTGLGSSTAVPLEPVIDRKALADDVVSILGGEVARQPEDPAVLQITEKLGQASEFSRADPGGRVILGRPDLRPFQNVFYQDISKRWRYATPGSAQVYREADLPQLPGGFVSIVVFRFDAPDHFNPDRIRTLEPSGTGDDPQTCAPRNSE
jgi:hypothetical protein